MATPGSARLFCAESVAATDPLFAPETAVWSGWVLIALGFLWSLPNLPLLMVFYFASWNANIYHPNLRALEIGWTAVVSVLALSTLSWSSLMVYQKIAHVTSFSIMSVFIRTAIVYGFVGLRLVYLAAIFERTVATIMYKRYEKRKLSAIVVGVIVFLHCCAFAIAAKGICNQESLFWYRLLSGACDLGAVFLVLVLYLWNRALHKANRIYPDISQRFQVQENLLGLRNVFYMILSGAFYNLVVMGADIFIAAHIKIDHPQHFIFYLGPGGFVLAQMVTGIFLHMPYQKRLLSVFPILAMCIQPKGEPQASDQITNAFGDKIVYTESMQLHFEYLEKAWRFPAR